MSNLRTHDGLTRYYNAWIPRARVDTDPLGVLLPSTVDTGVTAQPSSKVSLLVMHTPYRARHHGLHEHGA